jgi:hypothetical protein
MATADNHTLHIEDGSLTRIARVHEALRDMGLELCTRCHVWKDSDHIEWTGCDSSRPENNFSHACCTSCHQAAITPLAQAIREVAR